MLKKSIAALLVASVTECQFAQVDGVTQFLRSLQETPEAQKALNDISWHRTLPAKGSGLPPASETKHEKKKKVFDLIFTTIAETFHSFG